jgi:hypothetical protein
LNIDAAGLIAGTPTATGSFDVLLKASNAVSTSVGVNHLLLTVVAPCRGQHGSDNGDANSARCTWRTGAVDDPIQQRHQWRDDLGGDD